MPEDRWIRVSEAEKAYDEIAMELGKVLAERMQQEFMHWKKGPIPESVYKEQSRLLIRWVDGNMSSIDLKEEEICGEYTHYMILKEPVER